MYYIEDRVYDVKKLDFLVSLKKELDENNLLKYNNMFREYIKTVDVIVYGIKLGKYEKKVLDTMLRYMEGIKCCENCPEEKNQIS